MWFIIIILQLQLNVLKERLKGEGNKNQTISMCVNQTSIVLYFLACPRISHPTFNFLAMIGVSCVAVAALLAFVQASTFSTLDQSIIPTIHNIVKREWDKDVIDFTPKVRVSTVLCFHMEILSCVTFVFSF